jgi:hypothetical protein
MEMEQLGLKLQDFESEALYEFEELQTELLETRGIMEELQRKLGDSERKRSALLVSESLSRNHRQVMMMNYTVCGELGVTLKGRGEHSGCLSHSVGVIGR